MPGGGLLAILHGVDHVAVFARWPESEAILDRMGPSLPSELARDLYETMLHDVLDACAAAIAERRHLYWADAPGDRPRSRVAREAGFRESLQRGRDLGARLETAFDELLRRPRERVVVVFAAAPEVTVHAIREAFARLAAQDLVLGPIPGGGLYLIGLRRRAPELFRDLPWGSRDIHDTGRRRAASLGLTCSTLDPLSEVAAPADLAALAVRLAAGASGAARTAGTLRAWGMAPETAL